MSGLSVRLQKQVSGFDLDVDWTIRDELAVLFGFSGSGKSMTMRMIAGLLAPDAGSIECDGRCLYDSETRQATPVRERGFGYVSQDVALFPHMTVRANIAYSLKNMTRTEREERVAEMADAFHLEGLERHYPREISGGQKQRVALARALARRPRALLLDEPFSALDLPLRNELWLMLRVVQERHRIPVLMVTHDPYEARTMADRIIVYSRGRSIRSGTPLEVMSHPDCPEVDTLLVGWKPAALGSA